MGARGRQAARRARDRCGREIRENRKGFSCWSREDPGCGFVIWKAKAGKNLTPAIARELIEQGEDGKWRVEFDEPWAREGAKPPEEEPGDAGAAADPGAAAA